MRVSKRTQLKECMLSTGFPFRADDDLDAYLSILKEIIPKTAALRRPGSAALDLAYLAAGYTDGFFETGLSPWDIAAGSLLVTEAGGLIGNYAGEAPFLDAQEVMAANPKIYAQLVPILKPYSKFNLDATGLEQPSSERVAQTGTVSLKNVTSPTALALKRLREPLGR